MTTRFNAVAEILTDGVIVEGFTKQLPDSVNYLTIAGADVASATTVVITAKFQGITGTTTIDNLSDALGAVEGQPVDLWIKAGPLTIRNTGGGTGNIRTATGADRLCSPNEVVKFVFDGTNWREVRPEPGALMAYGKKTSSVTTTGTSFAAGADLLASALSFTADGVSDYMLEVGAPGWFTTALVDCYVKLNLDGADQGWIAINDWASINTFLPFRYAGLIPASLATAGAHTVNARIHGIAGSTGLTVEGGAGGAASLPIHVSLRKA